MKMMTVPGDGNCMFWSAMLAYLEPVKTDENELKKRCQKIFNNTKYWKEIFNYFNKNKGILDMKHLVILFRQNVVEYAEKNVSDQDKHDIKLSFDQFNGENKKRGIKETVNTIEEYFALMKKDGIYGEELTLKMISKFINYNIIVKQHELPQWSHNTCPEFKDKIYLYYSWQAKHYNYFQEVAGDNDSGYNSSVEITEDLKENNDKFSSEIEGREFNIILKISELQNDKDSSSNKLEEWYQLYIDTQGLAEYSLKLIDKNGIENIDKKIKMVDFVNAKIDYLLKCIEDLSIKPNPLNSEIKTEQEKLEVEAKTLELQNSKSDIESKIKIQENLKKFLTEEHATNVGKIKEINKIRENKINELFCEINNLNKTTNNINKPLFDLNNEISSIDNKIESKRKDIQKITEKIKNMEKKKASSWRLVIVILTFGICYRLKSFQRKIDKITEKKIIIEEEIKKLFKIKLQKMEKHQILHDQKKSLNNEKQWNTKKLENEFNDNNSSSEVKKITELQMKNDKINLELDSVNKQIYELKCNLIRTSCEIGTKNFSFEKNKSKINNENPITNINRERKKVSKL